jgi:hypothetical protein
MPAGGRAVTCPRVGEPTKGWRRSIYVLLFLGANLAHAPIARKTLRPEGRDCLIIGLYI